MGKEVNRGTSEPYKRLTWAPLIIILWDLCQVTPQVSEKWAMKLPLTSAWHFNTASAGLAPSIFLFPLPSQSRLLHPPQLRQKPIPIDRPVHRGIDVDGPLFVCEWWKTDGGGGSGGRHLEWPIKMSREEIYRPPLFPLMSTLSAVCMICVLEWKDDSEHAVNETDAPTQQRSTLTIGWWPEWLMSSCNNGHLKTIIITLAAWHVSMGMETPSRILLNISKQSSTQCSREELTSGEGAVCIHHYNIWPILCWVTLFIPSLI